MNELDGENGRGDYRAKLDRRSKKTFISYVGGQNYISIRSFDGYWLKNSLESGSQGRGDYRAKLDRRSKKIYFIRGWTKTMYLSIQSFDG